MPTQRGEGGAKGRVVDFAGFPGESTVRGEGDPAFQPAFAAPLDEVAGQRIEHFVAEGDSRLGIGREFGRIGDETDVFWERPEGFPLRRLKHGQGLGNHVFEGIERPEFQLRECAKHVGGQGAVMGAALDDPPTGWIADFPPLAEKPAGEQFAKQWPDAHTGEKIAVAADLAGAAGVVTETGFIERGRHEVRKTQGTVPCDPPAQQVPQRRGCGGRSDGINEWELCRLQGR